jgi:hypothetical protein
MTELPGEEDMRLPPRRVIHSTDATKAARIFQASLVVLLIVLTAGIIVWHSLSTPQ